MSMIGASANPKLFSFNLENDFKPCLEFKQVKMVINKKHVGIDLEW